MAILYSKPVFAGINQQELHYAIAFYVTHFRCCEIINVYALAMDM